MNCLFNSTIIVACHLSSLFLHVQLYSQRDILQYCVLQSFSCNLKRIPFVLFSNTPLLQFYFTVSSFMCNLLNINIILWTTMHKPFETYLSIQYIELLVDYLEYVFIYSIRSFPCKCVYTLYVYTFVTLFHYLLKIYM